MGDWGSREGRPGLRAEARGRTLTHGLKPVDQDGAQERGGGGVIQMSWRSRLSLSL